MESYSVQAVLSAVDKGFSSAFKEAADSANSLQDKVSKSMSAVGKSMAVAGAAITALGVSSLKSFDSFQQSLNQVAVIAGGTSKNIQELADVANKMGADLPLSAQDAADAMVAMARDGASIDTIKKEFPAIAEAATAAGSDLRTTASVVQQSMNLWGKSLESPAQAAAILTQTANVSNASIEDMQQVLADVGGTAQSMGYSLKDTATAVGLLTNRGIPAAQAAQNLNFAMTKMIKPTASASAMMDKLGISYYDAQGNMKPINQIAQELNSSMAGLTQEQKANALSVLFGQAGYKVMNGLMATVADTTDSTTTSWSGMSKAIEQASSSGSVATKFLSGQATEMQKNVGSKLEQVGGNWESLSNTAQQQAQGINGAWVDMINNALQWATQSNSAIASGIRGFLGLAPVIGAGTIALGGFLTATARIGTTLSQLGSVLVSPFGLALVAITALVAGVVYAYNNFNSFKTTVDNLGSSIKNVFIKVAGDAIGAFKGLIMGLSDDFNQIGQAIQDNFATKINSINFSDFASKASVAIQNVIGFIGLLATDVTQLIVAFLNTGAIQATWNAVKSVVQAVVKVISSIITVVGNVITSITGVSDSSNTFTALGTVIGNVIKVIMQIITAVAQFITKLMSIPSSRDQFQSIAVGIAAAIVAFKGIMTAISLYKTAINIAKGVQIAFNAVMAINPFVLIITAVVTVVAALVYFFTQTKTGQAIWQAFITFLSNAWTTIKTTASTVWTAIATFFTSIWNGIVTVVMTVWTSISTFLTTIWMAISTAASTVWTAIVTVLSTIWGGIVTTATTIWNGLSTFFSNLWTGISTIITGAWEIIKSIVLGAILIVLDFVTGNFTALKSDVSLIWNSIKDGLSSIWDGIKSVASTIYNAIKNGIINIWNSIKSTTSSVWSGIKSFVSSTWNGIKSLATSTWNGLKSAISNAWNSIKSTTSSVWNGIKSFISSVWNGIKSVAINAANNMVSGIKSVWSGVKSFASNLWNGVKSVIKSAMNFDLGAAGRAIMNSFFSGLQAAWGKVKNFVSGIASWIRKHKGPISYDRKLLIPAGNAIMTGLNAGLVDNFKTVQKNVSGMAGSILDAATSVGNLATNAIGDPINALNNNIGGSYSSVMTLDHTSTTQPANITIGFDRHGYTAYVADINNQQGKTALLKKNNSVQL